MASSKQWYLLSPKLKSLIQTEWVTDPTTVSLLLIRFITQGLNLRQAQVFRNGLSVGPAEDLQRMASVSLRPGGMNSLRPGGGRGFGMSTMGRMQHESLFEVSWMVEGR